MKLLLLLAVGLLVVKTSDGLPAGFTESSPDPGHLLFQALESFTTSQINQCQTMILNVLSHVPSDTEAYNYQRQHLHKFLQKVNEFQSKEGNCAAKMFLFLRYFDNIIRPYELENSSAEDKTILKLLQEYGLQDMRDESEIFATRLIGGDFGLKIVDGRAYGEFLKMQC